MRMISVKISTRTRERIEELRIQLTASRGRIVAVQDLVEELLLAGILRITEDELRLAKLQEQLLLTQLEQTRADHLD